MLRPWDFHLTLARNTGTSLHAQITQKIIEAIQSGRLTPGTALPGSRELASNVKINRKTVVQAYDELVAQGWLTCEDKRGTFVSDKILSIHTPSRNKKPALSKEAKALYFSHTVADEICFDDTLPESRLVPVETLSRAMRHALITATKHGGAFTQNTQGTLVLREAITQMLNMERGLHTKPHYICTTRSTQMSLYVVAHTLLKAGDYVALEASCCPQMRQVLMHCGVNFLIIQYNQQGIDLAHLEQLCLAHKIAAIYVASQQQSLVAMAMSESQKQQLLMLAERYQFKIIEHDTAHEFNFSNHPNLPMASAKKNTNIVYVGSLSKMLPVGLNVSYIVAHDEKLIQACGAQVALMDQQSNTINELCIAELLQTGEIKKHLLRAHRFYSTRRTWLISQLEQALGSDIAVELAQSGLTAWLKIPPHYHFNLIAKNLDAYKLNIAYQLEAVASNQYGFALRIGFANLEESEIILGIARLKLALNHSLKTLLTA